MYTIVSGSTSARYTPSKNRKEKVETIYNQDFEMILDTNLYFVT